MIKYIRLFNKNVFERFEKILVKNKKNVKKFFMDLFPNLIITVKKEYIYYLDKKPPR